MSLGQRPVSRIWKVLPDPAQDGLQANPILLHLKSHFFQRTIKRAQIGTKSEASTPCRTCSGSVPFLPYLGPPGLHLAYKRGGNASEHQATQISNDRAPYSR